VTAPEDGRSADALLAAAEVARDMASAEPGEPFRRLPAALRTAAEDRSQRQRELLEAAENGAFFPLFQPLLDLATGAIDRAEVLMRWQRTDGGVATPAVFLDPLRELDALARISDGVYRSALGEAAAWRTAGFGLTRLALNLDATQVARDAWAERLLALLEASPLPPGHVEVEVSENILEHAQLDRLVDGLVLLRAAGVRVSLDDFGTGYASLSQIADLPIDVVKLDARLLWDATDGPRTRLVVEGMVELMRKLALPCVFEGVETPAHLTLARALGARWAQGFLIGRPMPGPELEGHLAPPRRRPADDARARLALFGS
jgi:EAL domain-containing protein (putative c-di-GMP-specific phosphodiesterase class I)